MSLAEAIEIFIAAAKGGLSPADKEREAFQTIHSCIFRSAAMLLGITGYPVPGDPTLPQLDQAAKKVIATLCSELRHGTTAEVDCRHRLDVLAAIVADRLRSGQPLDVTDFPRPDRHVLRFIDGITLDEEELTEAMTRCVAANRGAIARTVRAYGDIASAQGGVPPSSSELGEFLGITADTARSNLVEFTKFLTSPLRVSGEQ